MDPGILDLNARVFFFPVRHHSPACARPGGGTAARSGAGPRGGAGGRRLARELQPAAILVEGPSDFNARLGELALPHRLPIAIYSGRMDHAGAPSIRSASTH